MLRIQVHQGEGYNPMGDNITLPFLEVNYRPARLTSIARNIEKNISHESHDEHEIRSHRILLLQYFSQQETNTAMK